MSWGGSKPYMSIRLLVVVVVFAVFVVVFKAVVIVFIVVDDHGWVF